MAHLIAPNRNRRMASSLTRLSERNHVSCNAVINANDFTTCAHITSQLFLFVSVPCWEQRFSTQRTTTIIQQTKTNNKQYNPLPPPGPFCYESFEQKKSCLPEICREDHKHFLKTMNNLLHWTVRILICMMIKSVNLPRKT